MNFEDFFEKILLSDLRIIGIGESHHGEHFPVFKKLAPKFGYFTGVFEEKPVNQRLDVNEYLETGIINDHLQRFFEDALKEGKDIKSSFLLILDAVKKYSLPIYCIDSSKVQTEEYKTRSTIGYWFLKGKSRDEDMFNSVMEKAPKDKEKWLLIGGVEHLKFGLHHRSGDVSLGKRLKEKYGNKAYLICMWKLEEKDKDFFEDEISCFDVSGRAPLDNNFLKFTEKIGYKIKDDEGNNYFDGYITHK